MKSITKFLLSIYSLICYSGLAQSPTFNTNINISNSFVCFGGQITVSSTTANADFYQFQKRNESTNLWENIIGASGVPNLSNGSISHTFYGINEIITTRVYISKNTEPVYSNELTITPQRPTFNFQPIDITECNGLNAIFRVLASGVNNLSYQWQENIGGVFQNATNSTDFSGMTSANLTVKSLINTENGRVFRCLVKDQNGCENYSSSATLFVNQLSTVVSPTVSTTYCEGDTAHFFVALKVGTVNNYEWQLKHTTDASYANLSESVHFEGVNSEMLSVNGILPTETSYRLNATFESLTQNTNGTRNIGSCIKSATRANYVVRARPASPIQIDDIYRCGEGTLTTSISSLGSFYWYSDTTKASILSNTSNFVSPTISQSKPYYYSLKDANQCESFKRKFMAIVRALPTQEYAKSYSICPQDNNLALKFTSKANNPLQLNVLTSDPTIPNFNPILNAIFSNDFNVSIPNNSPSGNYKFKLFTKNEHCYSDTSIIDLYIKQPTLINNSPTGSTICEGLNHTFSVQYQTEAPTSFKWLKDDILLPNETTSSLALINTTLQSQGQYKVEIAGQCGTAISENAQLNILPKIEITEQPKTTIVCQNGNTKIKLTATGTGQLTYEWTLNENAIGSNSSELILANVPISNNNARIKCKITSNCGPATYSNEILLLVDDLPSDPIVSNTIGFCKSNLSGTLNASAFDKHTLNWYDDLQNKLPSNQIDISSIFTKTYFVSQKDTNLCESPLSNFEVKVSEPFSLTLLADKPSVCSSGIFNRSVFINSVISSPNINLNAISYYLLQDNQPISNNNTGEFEIDEGGVYKITATKDYCSDTSEIEISSIHPDLVISPSIIPDFEVCKNSDLAIKASGNYSGGDFYWYSSSISPFQDFSGEILNLTNISSAKSYYVAYGITSNNIYCESPRVQTSVSLKPDLVIEAVIQNTTCLGINDGKVQLSINNGMPPFIYSLGNISNSTGLFENLSIGNYTITTLDVAGCRGSKPINIELTPGTIITQQPSNVSRCKSNIANFTLAASNYDQIIWEKKLPNSNSFEVIIGENLPNLRIENIGSTIHPHFTIYRAKITKGTCSIYTNEATLFVNSISGTGLSKTSCEGNNTILNLNDYNIVGSNKSYQWQYRQGTSGNFTDIAAQTNENLEILNFQSSNGGYYRCKITFDNGGGNSCIINTSVSGTKLTVDIPQVPILTGEKTICKGQTTQLSATNCNGILTWSDGKTGLQIVVNPNSTTTYTATCTNGTCNSISSNSVVINVKDSPINAPNIVLSKTKYCYSENIILSAQNCDGIVIWSNGLQGNSIETIATSNFTISAHCKTEFCQSPESQSIAITIYPIIAAGSIVSNNTINCSGFNPLTINSVENPISGNIQWQKSENCTAASVVWSNIVGENGPTYNPPALLTSTCFRRIVSDSCQTLYSNITNFEIRPDPILEISADKNETCFGQKVVFSKTLIGGEGICSVQWQINKVSSAVSSTFWKNIEVADILEYTNNNAGNDSTFHFRAKVDCSNSSCNLSTSNAISVVFRSQLGLNTAFSDSTICSGTFVTLTSSGCKSSIIWSTGETSAQISVSPSTNTTYTVSCKNSCDEISKSINIVVVSGISTPIISVSKTKYCLGENIQISASNCSGEVIWNNEQTGSSINILATSNFTISAHCKTEFCQSPESQSIGITVYPILTAGSIASNNTINCSGFNPLTINSIENPSSGNIQWQKSENCNSANVVWANIVGENGPTYNPPALLTSTCFRRMVSDSCQTLYSNITNFEIRPDPILEISADKNETCFGQKVVLSKKLIGGEGICSVQWQINKVSSAVSSTFWKNLEVADILEYTNNNAGNDSTFHFRAKVDCSNSSCNLATSNAVSVVFRPQLSFNTAFSDSTICSGTFVTLTSSGCKSSIIWSTGETSAQISVSPSTNTTYTVSCKNSCAEIPKSINIVVVPGISMPINTTPESSLSPNTLIFSAVGQNLKWYTSINSNIPITQSPIINIPGEYTFWVTQTIGICESPKLKVQSELLPALEIITQPNILTNCYGNTSNILINATGSGIIKYKWQRKKPDETAFSDISISQKSIENFETKELKIKSIGNAESPNSSKFRCIIADDFQEIQSQEIEITVNRLDGSLANQKLCLGNNFELNLNKSHNISGSPLSIQWQHRQGTGGEWINLKDSASISGVNSLHFSINNLTAEHQKQYRCSIIFNSSTGTCTETTDLMTLTVGSFPPNPQNIGFEFCQNSSSPKLELYEPNNLDIIWYLPGSQNPLTKQPIIDTKTAGNQVFFYSFKNANECESPKSIVQIIINQEPPKPVNTTPIQIIEGQNLVFSAIGENLKWYTSRTGKTFSSISPTHQKVGKYDYYVSQTSPKGCESVRAYLESEIIAAFGITIQPINQANCEDNTTTFSIKTKGSTFVKYRWQILKNNVFEDIIGENSSTYKIDDVGKAPNLDGTIYRCIVSNSFTELISDEVTLKVNKIEGKLADYQFCESTKVDATKFRENIIGNIAKIEWQKKESDAYQTIFTSEKLADKIELNSNKSGDYRLRITFQNQGSSTCLRTSNTFKITVNKKPESLSKVNYQVCQYASLKTVLKQFPLNFELKNLDSSLVGLSFLNESANFIGNYWNQNGCSNDYQKIRIEVLPAPKLELSDTTLTYCQFSKDLKTLQINDLNTLWFSSETDDEFSENEFSVNTSTALSQYKWLAIENTNGCLSQKKKVKMMISPCFYEGNRDTCINQNGKTLLQDEWNYFYDENGRIFAAIHPNGQNMGTVKIDLRGTKDHFLKDKSQNSLYPRYFNIQTSRKSNIEFKVRFFMTLDEIQSLSYKKPEQVSIINYNGQNTDCELLNNELSVNYWLETNTYWKLENQQNIYFVEFNTQKTGEFGLWNMEAPKGILSGKINSAGIPELSISEKNSSGTYTIMKSKDGKTWFNWNENSEKSNFLDLKPFSNDNYYQLIYDFGNGIKSALNTVKITLNDDELPCLILENPSENRDFVKLYFPNIDKTSIILNTALGQTLQVLKITEIGEHLEIYPNTQLSAGFYTIKAQNTFGKNCSLKIWIR